MALAYRQFGEAEADLLVDFLTRQSWPYHVFDSLSEELVRTNLAEGYYGSESTRTFWITDGKERVGLIRLEDLEGSTPMFDLRLAAEHCGRGIGGQSLGWLTRYLFTEFDEISRVEGTTRQDNTAMRRTFRSHGYVKEAHYRNAWPSSTGAVYDAIGYGILRRDWLSGSRTPVRWDDEPTVENC
ncbi:GNAT family protein [Kitasatospora sp. GP82]|uniref:GNAT family N-acetyltransferase n=1 Tax=Kitasatospora sp. GP82 TaxID=3035089 RepID=UPI002476A803|nr:GNAT family protein [Kitasatospora sp. GP82]MDH6129287.1 RimJ/RimL family protein N-acetyltransferase [Kitasatospora sp. GP82]